MKKLTLILAVFLSTIMLVQAQIITKNVSKSEIENRNTYKAYAGKLKQISLSGEDWEKIKKENKKVNPTQFGHKINVDFVVKNAGAWYVMENGDRIWALEVNSKGASSLSFQYDEFYIPPGAKLIIYNKAETILKGPITSAINRSDQTYATGPLPGETSIIEYHEPANCTENVKLNIKYVVHDYSDIIDSELEGLNTTSIESDIKFGGSTFDTNSVMSTCDNNVTCYSSWQAQAEGVCRMLKEVL